ncbi:PREDICTED: ribosomal RNA-processing protein 7 homolog A [Nicrophorus vespilloides]|uniref:Ribosomal RNA-processing protein 7 homolog A n=1 Tax=Nicrophorus vespilloides TaxID=110193 RepID=A0ABM1MNE3_NICVS|nr:PREDICTED: ribosomal RNA-processing protein 7 homolog A [Nicrophorus vespilloides]
MAKQNNLQGFKVITTKYCSSSNAEHELFIKEHSVKNQAEDQPIGRTLFLINIPPWATESALLNAFKKSQIKVESVKFAPRESHDNGFRNAFVVVDNGKSVVKALKLSSLPPLSTDGEKISLGLEQWAKSYNDSVNCRESLIAKMTEVVTNYDFSSTKEKEEEKNQQVDDEGWTVVTKKKGGMKRTERAINKIKGKMERKEKALKNFYRHQIRQEKKDQLVLLRKKVEEDKKRILTLRQRRAFKPF